MSSGANATVKIEFSDKRRLEIVLKSLDVEAKKPATGRSSVDLGKQDLSLVLHVKAKDTVALRSTLNTYLRWIGSMLDAFAICSSS